MKPLMEKYEALNRQKKALSERETQMQDMAVSIDDIEDLVKEVCDLQKQEADQVLLLKGNSHFGMKGFYGRPISNPDKFLFFSPFVSAASMAQ
ncbi:hypothetical protein Tco_0904043 [Tanacetum coccineum]